MTNKEWEQMNLSDKINRFNRRVMIPAIIIIMVALGVGVVWADAHQRVDPGKSGAVILAR